MATNEGVESTESEETQEVEDTEDEANLDVTGSTDEDETDDDEDDDEVVSRKELEKVTKTLAAVRKEKRELAKEIQALKRAQSQKTDEKNDGTEEAESKAAEAVARAERYRDIAIKKEVTLALQDAGAKVSANRLIKLMDLEGVDFNASGVIEGLEDAIAELKEENPEFFKGEEDEEKPKPRIRKPGPVDSGTKTPPQKKQTTTEKLLAQSGLKFK